MEQALKPGELPLYGATDANIRHNFQLRRERNGGSGYLLDSEAEWLLRSRAAPVPKLDSDGRPV